MIRLRFHQPTKRAGDWPLRFVRRLEKAGNSRALLSQKSIAADVRTYAAAAATLKWITCRAEIARVAVTATHDIARRMFPFYSHSYFSLRETGFWNWDLAVRLAFSDPDAYRWTKRGTMRPTSFKFFASSVPFGGWSTLSRCGYPGLRGLTRESTAHSTPNAQRIRSWCSLLIISTPLIFPNGQHNRNVLTTRITF